MDNMMKIIRVLSALFLCVSMLLTACAETENNIKVNQPNNISTKDQIIPAKKLDSVEESPNVNGMRFSMTLDEFTEKYNTYKRINGETDLIIAGNWYKNGGVTTDNNGVKIQYYYYDDYNVNFTATVEADNNKILNIGLGTTTSNFMAQTDGEENSETILKKAALMAQIVCQFPENSLDMLQNIFYEITIDANDTLWYEGFVFSLSTDKKETDSKKRTMLFRVFPITDELKTEWNIGEYQI